jgi:hypothetical protein
MKTGNPSDDMMGPGSVYCLVYGVRLLENLKLKKKGKENLNFFFCHETVQIEANYFPFWYTNLPILILKVGTVSGRCWNKYTTKQNKETKNNLFYNKCY